ncbi:SNF2 family N-terminal domain-containing protein, partial [Annulohypoxylon nitens]
MANYEVCYGALHDAVARISPQSKTLWDLAIAEDNTPFIYLDLREKDDFYVLCSNDGVESAVLDTRTVSRLNALKGSPTVRFEAAIQCSIFTKRQRGSNKLHRLFPVSINIFGSKSAADDTASRFAKLSTYLQHPKSLHTYVEYHNPQFLLFDDDKGLNMNDFIGMGNESSWDLKIRISGEIGTILESLTDVSTTERLVLPTTLTSTLKKHQEDGVRFILQREDAEFTQRLKTQLCQIVTTWTEEKRPFLGGIIADVMGLGKTLTMLAAILHSLPRAEFLSNFYDKQPEEEVHKVRTKATLVVVSSAQLLEIWVSEVQSHICPDALSFIRFHGNSRPQSPEDLRSSDVVFTTYATLAADQAGRHVLHQIEWFRVVLDEAHWIRNSSSKQFRAAASLYTRRRWCLTGTPIQNKLEDLTSLAQFLQLPPVSTKSAFQRHVLGPLSRGGPNFAKPLRTYLEAYCLRRSERCLTLPPSKQENVLLQLSPVEQRLYTQVLDETRRQIDCLVSKGDNIKCSMLFTAIIKMRMICDLGTFSTASSRSGSLGESDVEVGCERCSMVNDENLMLLSGCLVCPDCGRPLRLSDPLSSSTDSQRGDEESSYDDANAIAGGMTQTLAEPSDSMQQGGISTKLSAVVENVRLSGLETKNIIFSCWTSTLDVLYQMLDHANIPCLQIDGRVGDNERSTRLRTFKENSEVKALLMSIGTGAVGLNLTIANRVHIVEPQWNPAVEEQAIARAIRMGQTQEVTIVRYMMERTVEQNIVNLQQKKKRLAKFTFDSENGENLSGTLEDLKMVLNLDH